MSKSLDDMTYDELARMFPVIISDYKPVWARRYLKEKAVLEQAIGSNNIVRISHIGSTAIPGLTGKPTIDILVEINDDCDTTGLVFSMQSAGYRYLEQPEKPPPYMMFIKGYTPQGFKGQVFHVHIRYSGDWDELYFRDYLLVHPETAGEYGRLKLELKKKYEYDREAYTEAKTNFIRRVNSLARQEARENT